MNQNSEKLVSLRSAMSDKNIDFYIIPSTDPHLGEYIPDHWRIIKWLTGFSGSAGTVIISDSFAGLWTDSRYFLQAESQLNGTGFVLIKPSADESQDFVNWMVNKISKGSKIALDGRIFSVERIRKLSKLLTDKDCSLDKTVDLISELWTDRPEMPLSTAFDHSSVFCGKERFAKIGEVREEMRLRGIDYQLLTSPEDIMWLLNIRGNDIKYNPLLLSYAIIDLTQILLFIDESKIPLKLASEFDRLDIVMLPYEEIAGMLSVLSLHTTLYLNPLTTSSQLFDSIPEGIEIIEGVTIPTLLKAVKNSVEIENIGKVMIKDGVALTRFFYLLEQNSDSKLLSELSAGEKLNILRSENEYYLGPSFSPIVAFNDHGALPHYSASVESDYVIGTNGILLVDSGGQYLDGTTDITRTIAVGKPSEHQKHDFSLVLKGMINLAQAKFPEGSKGYQLDFIARKALWENGLNYGHGTGHGVGFCLNVHEGPQSISPLFGTESKTVIQAGMLISDEPAVYRTGEYGIRTENLLICYEDDETEFGKFLKFETVSLCYIDKTLIDISLMDQKEIDWLNAYHSEVYEKLSPYLTEAEKLWLHEKTNPL
jgi:Xaa-Pro aminopeptidase